MYFIFLQKNNTNKHILEAKYWQLVIFYKKKHITINNKQNWRSILKKIFQKDFAITNNKIELDILTNREYWNKTIDINIINWLYNKELIYSNKYLNLLSFYNNNETLIPPNILLNEIYNIKNEIDILNIVYNTNILYNLYVPYVLSYLNQHKFNINLTNFNNNLYIKKQNKNKDIISLHNNYKPFTKTLRPTNNNNGFNFMSLDENKKNSIILEKPIIEIDFSAFHIQILAKLLNEELPHNYTNWHKFLHETYFNDKYINYNDFKKFIFNILYSEKLEKYNNIPLLRKIINYKSDLLFSYDGKIITNEIINYFDNPNIETLTENQIFNYTLQQLEVETIFNIMFNLIKDGIKIIYYLYDSFYIEYNNKEEIKYIQNYLKEYQYKIKYHQKNLN